MRESAAGPAGDRERRAEGREKPESRKKEHGSWGREIVNGSIADVKELVIHSNFLNPLRGFSSGSIPISYLLFVAFVMTFDVTGEGGTNPLI